MAPFTKKARTIKDIDIWYEECQSSEGDLNKLEELGITSTIWQIFVNLSSSSREAASSSDLVKEAFIFIRMINSQSSALPSCEMNGPLSFVTDEAAFRLLLHTIEKMPPKHYLHIVHFLTIAFNNITKDMNPFIREPLTDMVGIKLWKDMRERYRELELRRSTAFRRRWSVFQSSDTDSEDPCFFTKLYSHFMDQLQSRGDAQNTITDMIFQGQTNNDGDQSGSQLVSVSSRTDPDLLDIGFLAAMLQLTVDLLSNPTTRRFLKPYIISRHISVKCKISSLIQRSNLFMQMVQSLKNLEDFPIDEVSSSPLSQAELTAKYHGRAHILQKICLRHYPDELYDVIYAGVGLICKEDFLRKNFHRIVDTNVLIDIAHRLRLLDKNEEKYGEADRKFIITLMIDHHAFRQAESMTLSQLPLYPDETLLWNPNLIPADAGKNNFTEKTLALPKVNIQFLSYGDYLLRFFKLLRLESAYEIRNNIVDVIKRMRPAIRHSYSNDTYIESDEKEHFSKKRYMTEFHGWSRMGLELLADGEMCPVKILKVAPPRLGESIPTQVLAQLTIDLKHLGGQIRKEWDELREYDNLFLIGVDATSVHNGLPPSIDEDTVRGKINSDGNDFEFPKRYGILAVRGCMVIEVKDEYGNILSDPMYEKDSSHVQQSHKRYVKIQLDPAQYAADATGTGSPFGINVYQLLNVVMRRHGRENNFKAILETIQGLMQGVGSIHRSVPKWIQPVLLGHGDPKSATYTSLNMKKFASITNGVTSADASLDYGDTFLDEKHLRDSFNGVKILVDDREEIIQSDGTRMKYRIQVKSDKDQIIVSATSYPFLSNVSGNSIRFTPVQVSAIRSGLNAGLSIIIGPPGTGKTDVAVQIIANLYHSFPTQRTVLITHSNAALNDLFRKVVDRGDIDERFLLRLGSGERDLKTNSEFDFTKIGRVHHILARRAYLLEQVQLLSESIGVSGSAERGPDGSPSYTCETAEYFHLHHIKKRIEVFKVLKSKIKDKVGEYFPFGTYFKISPQSAVDMTMKDAENKFCLLDELFAELIEYRPLELLRSQRQRADYLLTNQTRIVAMTCTHAAIARNHLIEVGFQYDNIIVEEAAQMTDVETFIPLLLQKGELDSSSRLKRICLIGDHHQLPPVIKNVMFAKYSNLDQSLFTRMIRMGVPTIELDKQGRSRPEIASLYSWRYNNLGHLDHVYTEDRFLLANTGFAFTYQLVNVEDFEGRGEYSPTPYFFQNTGEAEYAVALFQYMVLIGTPPDRISILTTYNGQKELLNDIINQRCSKGTPLDGVRPGAIATVDQYQGQQNDYVILSLVRTKHVGHIRDIRRLIVAVSRARLGLYVLCRENIFTKCFELKTVMDQFSSKPMKLELVIGEEYPTTRRVDDPISTDKMFVVDSVEILGSIVHKMQEQVIA